MIDILKLARQAGIDVLTVESERASMWPATPEGLARFAELVLEEAANKVKPKTPRPCDCERCDCGNATDARMVAEWDEEMAMAAAIRAMKPNAEVDRPQSGRTQS